MAISLATVNQTRWKETLPSLRFTKEEKQMVMTGRKIQLRVWANKKGAPWRAGDEVVCVGPDGVPFAKAEILKVTTSTLMGGTVQDLFDEGFLYSEQLIEAFFKTHIAELKGLLLVDEIAPHPVWVVRFRRLLFGITPERPNIKGARSFRRQFF